MVAAISATPSSNRKTPQEEHAQNPARPPLLPSEKDNGVVPRRPKAREVTSRYLSSSTSTSSSSSTSSSRRCPSPIVSRTAATSNVPDRSAIAKRSQSAERRRPVTPRPVTPLPDSWHGNAGGATDVSAASKVLWTSTRSLSVSFQGESFSLPISMMKTAPQTQNLSNARKGATPERRRTTPLRSGGGGGGDQLENSKPMMDQHRWPAARTRLTNPLTRSMDFGTNDNSKLVGNQTGTRMVQQSMIDEGRQALFDGRFRADLGTVDSAKLLSCKTGQLRAVDADSDNGSPLPCDLTASDTDSVSSGSNSGTQEFAGMTRSRVAREISVPARFWQETNSRLRKLQEPGLPLSITGSRTRTTSKLISSKKGLPDSPSSSPRTLSTSQALSSPLRGPIRPPPSKLMVSSTSSPLRGMASPLRTRSSSVSSVSSQYSNAPSILSLAADVRRGKMGENKIENVHLFRLLYNRHLQWRFVNARADVALTVQRLTAEKNLYNAWVTTSELRDTVTVGRVQLQRLRQNLKLLTILKGQMPYLEDWALLERDHSSSLSGAIEALKASTLRLPVIGGARADIQKVKDAVGSAVDMMQVMGSSMGYILSKVERVNSLVAELANVTAQERALLGQCKDMLSAVAAMQVEECSLRTHLLQLKRLSKLTQL